VFFSGKNLLGRMEKNCSMSRTWSNDFFNLMPMTVSAPRPSSVWSKKMLAASAVQPIGGLKKQSIAAGFIVEWVIAITRNTRNKSLLIKPTLEKIVQGTTASRAVDERIRENKAQLDRDHKQLAKIADLVIQKKHELATIGKSIRHQTTASERNELVDELLTGCRAEFCTKTKGVF